MRKLAAGVILSLLTVITASQAWSSGFALYNYSSASIAQGGAVIAHNDDSSAIFFNPALMNQLEQSQVRLGINYITSSVEFTSDATGKTFKLKDTSHYIPTLFAIHRISDRMSAGLGVFSNFGLSSTWDDSWEGRYLATHSELITITFNPVVSFRVTPQFFIAGGVSISRLDAELNRILTIDPNAPALDIKQKLTGDDTAFGYNAGLLVDITEDVSFGISYRSKIKAEFKGDVDHQVPSGLGLESTFPDTSAETTLNLPPQAFVGIAYSGINSFVFEVSVKWEGWSEYDKLKIILDEPIATETAITLEKNWKDVYPVSFGAQYHVNDMFDINAGYTYDPSPIPDDMFEPSVPDSDGHIFSLGVDINLRKIEVGLLYAYKKYEDREKNNTLDDNDLDTLKPNPLTSANGTYKSSLHMVGVDVAYLF